VAIVGGLAALGVAAALVLNAFQSNLVFFFTPTQVAKKEVPIDRNFRVGGLVEGGTVVRQKDALSVTFKITDGARSVPVTYTGILPTSAEGRAWCRGPRGTRRFRHPRSCQARRELHAPSGGRPSSRRPPWAGELR
jgi:hypothetical protein